MLVQSAYSMYFVFLILILLKFINFKNILQKAEIIPFVDSTFEALSIYVPIVVLFLSRFADIPTTQISTAIAAVYFTGLAFDHYYVITRLSTFSRVCRPANPR